MDKKRDVGFDRRAIPPYARESMWSAPDGHPIRMIDWGAPPEGVALRGSLLFMAGRGDVYEKYIETLEHWRRKGWHVSAADWRGQAGSGRLGEDERTGHIEDFMQWVDDLSALWQDWSKRSTGPYVLAAHSMGGHICLRAAAEQVLAPAPDALVLSAPMLDVFPEHLPPFAKRAFARLMIAIGSPTKPAWKMSERPLTQDAERQSLLTHDDERYADEGWWREQRPELQLGPGSWGWVKAAAESVRALFVRGKLEAVSFPVFFVATSADGLVSPSAIKSAIARLPNVEALIFGKEARHEILRETDDVRDKALDAIDDFLARKVSR